MKLKAIRQEARFRLDDEVRPYFWKDEWLDAAINEAEREACIRARLIEDNSSNVTSNDIVTTEKRYELSPLIIDVLAIEMASRPGCNIAGWTLTESELVLDNYPSSSDTLLLTVVRLPLSDMCDDNAQPEIRDHHHEKLIDWVEYRAYMVQDADSFNPVKAQEYEAAFERSFGRRPDAGVQRKQRKKTGRVVRMNPF